MGDVEQLTRVKQVSTPARGTSGRVRVRGGRQLQKLKEEIKPKTKLSVAPKIPQRRKKEQQLETPVIKKESTSSRKNDRGRGDRGRGRGRKEYTQVSGSLFGEGVYADPQRRAYHGSDRDTRDSVPKPVFKIRKEAKTKEELQEEERRVQAEDECDSDSSNDDYLPVQLPLVATRVAQKDKKIDLTNIKEEQEVKPNSDSIDMKPDIKDIKLDVGDLKELKIKCEDEDMGQDLNLQKALDDKWLKQGLKKEVENKKIKVEQGVQHGFAEDNMLYFLQFPNCLPFNKLKISDNTETPTVKEENRTSASNAQSPTTLKDVEEGFIGKLQFLKSGKTRLMVGSIELEVECMDSAECTQEVVAIRKNENNSSATVLGYIGKQMSIFPVFQRDE